MRTGDWPLSRVDLQVHLQMVLVGEPFVTLGAAIWFLPCVDPLVPLQAGRVGETGPAQVAAERFLPRVHPLVDLHLLGETKGFPTERTPEALLFGAATFTDSVSTTVICQWACVAIYC